MDLPAMINQMKNHPDFSKAGMVLYHNGVVRDSSRDGLPVTGLTVTVDREKLDRILDQTRAMPGVITSYSIHYTKLYDGVDCCRQGAVSTVFKSHGHGQSRGHLPVGLGLGGACRNNFV